jgi:hypothetical protein
MQPDPNQPGFSGAPAPGDPQPFQPQPVAVPTPYAGAVAPGALAPQPGFIEPAPTVIAPQVVAPAGAAVAPPVENFGFAPVPSSMPPVGPIAPAPQAYQQPIATLPPQQPIMPTMPQEQQIQQPFQLQQPLVAQPLMPAAPLATMTGSSASFNSSKKSRLPKIIGIAIAALVLIGVIAAAVIGIVGTKQITYSKSDLVSVSTKAYSVNRAKQWTDLSGDQKVLDRLKASVGSDTPLSDQKVFGYKYDPKTDQGQTLLLIADTPLGVSDDDLRRGLTDTAAKQQFELSFKALANSLDNNSLCASTSGKTETINYDTTRFLVEVKADADCNYSASSQTKYGTKGIHQSVLLGIKNGNTFLATMVASKDDWTANGKFYTENIINSVQPK